MKKILILMLGMVALAGQLAAHAQKEVGVFNPPHGGAFTKMANGDYAEVYLKEGMLNICFLEGSGSPSESAEKIKGVVLKASPKGEKDVILKADSVKEGCASWKFSTKSKLLRIEIRCKVAGKPVKAKLAYELKEMAGASLGGDSMAKAKYVCPMDGYTSDKPGKCPKCGMDLVQAKNKGEKK